MSKRHTTRVSTVLAIALLLAGFFLRVVYLTEDRFHADEALYAGWALRILDGAPYLLQVPVDKPPLYLYLLAASMRALGRSEVAARLPNLAASMLNVALVYALGARLYDRRTALWAMFFAACSPFEILFARTAFTDPLLVTFVLGALVAIDTGRWFWAGLLVGLGFATKQHAVALIPLVLAVGWLQAARPKGRRLRSWGAMHGAGLLGFALPYALVVWWDAQRWAIRPGYWQQSAMSYGGLAWTPLDEWGTRLLEWLSWARYLVGSPLLYALLALGGAVLVVQGWRQRHTDPRTRLDTAFVAYGWAYVLAHTFVQFSIWDRYLLPLVPLAGLLLARIVVEGVNVVRNSGRSLGMLFAAVVCVAVVASGWKAARNGYPVGGEHWAYQGLDQVAAYLVAHAPPDAVLYHHWLRWHYSYYLYGTGFELRWWQSGEHLLREAARTPDRAQYIVLPDWRTLEPETDGVVLEPVYETYRRDGSVSLRVYRIRLASGRTSLAYDTSGTAE